MDILLKKSIILDFYDKLVDEVLKLSPLSTNNRSKEKFYHKII